jgi:putative PEP-CTERM system TPR-repeat lipoprotein
MKIKGHMNSKLLALGKLAGAGLLTLSLVACSGKTADEHIQEALVFAEQGDNAAAIVELKNAVQQEPTLALARYELGRIYLQTNDFQSAEKELSRALELGYPADQIIPMLSEAYQRTGANVALSELDLEELSLTPEQRMETNFRKLQALLQLEKTEEARALIEQAATEESTSVFKGLIAAHENVLDSDFAGALAQAQVLYEAAPLNRDVLSFTARLYMLNDQPEQAASMYEDYVKVAVDDIQAKFALANMLVEQGQMSRAEVYVDELMAVNDTNPLLNQLKGVIRAADNDYANALAFSEKAIQAGRNDPTIRLVAGFSSYQLGEFEKAVGHLSFIASLLPDGHPGLRILAASQLQTDMNADAGEVLSRIDNVSAADASLFSRAGFELLQEGDVDAARQIIEQADKISESADDLTRLGVLKLSLNDIEGLIDLQQAVEKAPESVTARTTLASAYLSTEQYDNAMDLAKEWQLNAPNDVEGYLLEVEVHQRLEAFDEAAEVLSKVEALAPNNTAVSVSKIRLLLRQNKNEEAEVATNELLAIEPTNVTGLASFFAIKQTQGNVEQGLARLQQAYDSDSSNPSIAILLGRAALAANDPTLSAQVLKSITPNRSAPSEYWPLNGAALLRNNQVDEALSHYETWLDLYPMQQDAALGQLLILDGQGRFEQALNLTNDFLARKNDLQMTFMQAYFYAMNRDFVSAKARLEQIEERYQPLPFLRGVKARVALSEGRATDAIDDALAAYEQSKSTNNVFLLVETFRQAGDEERLYEILNQHMAERPNDLRAKMVLAEIQIERDANSAIETYTAMLESTPNNFVVLNNLAYLLMQDGDLASAEEYAERAYGIRPDSVPTADTYAQVLVKQARYEDAVEIYNKVMSDDVQNEEIVLNYIDALFRNGSTVIAKRRLEERTFADPESLSRVEAIKAEFNL